MSKKDYLKKKSQLSNTGELGATILWTFLAVASAGAEIYSNYLDNKSNKISRKIYEMFPTDYMHDDYIGPNYMNLTTLPNNSEIIKESEKNTDTIDSKF